jgi:hypothetical protein
MTLCCVARIAVATRRRETLKPRSANFAFTASFESNSSMALTQLLLAVAGR